MAPPKEDPISKYYYPVGFAACGFGTGVVNNYYAKRPWYSGIQRHIAFTILGAFIGYYADRYLENKWRERDALVKHYIELHPEDFLDNKRKYKEVFDEWYPVR